jgi:T5SS/PEP-CTERM-associated repeat protein
MKTKSISETAPKLTTKLILIAIAALALSVSPRSRADAALCGCLRHWDNLNTGDWFDPLNWAPYHDYVPGCGGPICPIDGGTTEADINNGGTAQITTLAQTARACEVFIGKDSGQSGNLSVDHATLEQCNEMWVGYGGKGTLKITNGGLVTTPAGANVAAMAGSNGAATLDGSNPDGRKSTWTVNGGGMYVGGTNAIAGGTALLTVTNEGRVNAANVQVWGSGTLTGNGIVTATNGTTIGGTLTPRAGTLTIVGDLTFGSDATMECNVVPAAADNVSVSAVASLDGKISVTMTGSTFTAGTTYTLLHAAGGFDPNHHMFRYMSIKPGTGDCFTPIINYDANNVYLYLSPCSN